MEKNQKIAIAVIVVIALIAAWQLGKKPATQSDENQNQTYNEQTSGENAEPTMAGDENSSAPKPTGSMTGGQSGQAMAGNTWEGTLKQSDNAAKGNLMISVDGHMVYIRTSRDYSGLVGKNVTVTYQGTMDNFTLGDITAK